MCCPQNFIKKKVGMHQLSVAMKQKLGTNVVERWSHHTPGLFFSSLPFPTLLFWDVLQKMEEALPLGSSFRIWGGGSGPALGVLPQKPQTDPSLYGLSGGGQSCPSAFPERPGRSREEQGECSALLDASSPPLGCREGVVGSWNPRSPAGGLKAVTAIV